MKAVMMSIQPKWCELIASGKKTVEVRKTRPKLEAPFKCYIYETKAKDHYAVFHENTIGKVIGEFVCDDIVKILNCGTRFILERRSNTETNRFAQNSCLDFDDMKMYLAGGNNGYAWHISNFVIYDEPKELSEFHLPCNSECDGCCEYGCVRMLKRPPQSWFYVEELR